MQSAAPRHIWKVTGPLILQALLWAALTMAFATLLVIGSPQQWPDAIRFSAFNWMPWAILGPIVFWFSGRFPLERGHWLRSVPAHLIGCAGCVAITVWVAALNFSPRPAPRTEDRAVVLDHGLQEREPGQRSLVTLRDEPRRNPGATPRTDHPERFGRGGRGERDFFNRRGAFGFPFLGATLVRANFDAAVYLIVVVAAHALAFYRRAQERDRHAMALAAGLNRAKLDALRLQLQPHFLFNTLNAISTLVHRDPNAADELIGDLSELLRLALHTSEHEVPLARELELLDCYLAIEQTRLGERLRIVREIDPAATEALVPTLALQPLVENAVRHGIEPRLAPGTITIRAERRAAELIVCVADDGVGLKPNPQRDGRRGIGIANTEARLRALHGNAARLVLGSSAAGGVEVRITLPFVTKRATEPATAVVA